jgi:diguanylate cyclase (GGDEF)-like protein
LERDPVQEVERLRRQVSELETLLTCQRRTAANALDEETGMASRVVLLDRIRQAIERCRRRDSKLAVLRVDVLTAERISEALGDEASHQIMREVGRRLKQALRATDTIAMVDDAGIGVSVSRSDRGEFVVVLSDMDTLNDATWVIQRVLKVLAKPFSHNSHEIYLRATIGASQFPADGDDAERLLARSGIALNEAKSAAGGDAFAFYSEELDRESKEQILIESQLHRAVGRGELFLEYQPVVDLRSGRIAAMEALLRWRHPERGIVPPGAFIPIAEHTGVIESIGEWVIETACRQLRLWRKTGHEQIKMAINLSPIQFRRCDLAERILATVDAERLPPEALNFEITESVLMQNLSSAATVVAELRDAGVGVSLDDFGTGYSSLGYLKRFPVDTVKIDRSFLREFPNESNDAAIVHAIISMAHSLGLRVIAEGVETDEQLKSLQLLQCDEVQGFLLSRPVGQDAATAILEQFPAIRQKIRSAGQPFDDTGPPGAQNAAVNGLLNELPSRCAAEN